MPIVNDCKVISVKPADVDCLIKLEQTIITVSFEDLVKAVKLATKMKAYWAKRNKFRGKFPIKTQYIHLAPNVSLNVDYK